MTLMMTGTVVRVPGERVRGELLNYLRTSPSPFSPLLSPRRPERLTGWSQRMRMYRMKQRPHCPTKEM